MSANTRHHPAVALNDKDLFRVSPLLTQLVGEGVWHDTGASPAETAAWKGSDPYGLPSFQVFRQEFVKNLDDVEEALLALRRLRIRTLLELARADLEDRIKPYQVRTRLRSLAEMMIQGAWLVAESSLRERYVHPLVLERRNVKPPVAVCSLSRLGSGDPWYTTGPAPIFVHSRAAEFAPALTDRDFMAARRTEKEWLPAREYFHRLASRTMNFLAAPNAAGRGIAHMAEDQFQEGPPLLPGTPVVLFASLKDHFGRRSIKERLSLIRLRFLVGQERLGRAVETAARDALMQTALDLGTRLKTALNAWYRERALAEGIYPIRGGILDIERVVRLLQFRHVFDQPDVWDPSPLKALDRLARLGAIRSDERLLLEQSYKWQWFIINRLTLLHQRPAFNPEALHAGALDQAAGLPGASERTRVETENVQPILRALLQDSPSELTD